MLVPLCLFYACSNNSTTIHHRDNSTPIFDQSISASAIILSHGHIDHFGGTSKIELESSSNIPPSLYSYGCSPRFSYYSKMQGFSHMLERITYSAVGKLLYIKTFVYIAGNS